MEGDIREAIGPQYGFDLQHIDAHYRYFRTLRKEHTVLVEGDYIPLHVRSGSGIDIRFSRWRRVHLPSAAISATR